MNRISTVVFATLLSLGLVVPTGAASATSASVISAAPIAHPNGNSGCC